MWLKIAGLANRGCPGYRDYVEKSQPGRLAAIPASLVTGLRIFLISANLPFGVFFFLSEPARLKETTRLAKH